MKYNFANALIDAARLSPQKVFIVAPDGGRHTFDEVLRRVSQASEVLGARGVEVGSRVGLRLPNTLDFIVYYFALLGLGAVVFPVNPAATKRELDYISTDADLLSVILAPDDSLRHTDLAWRIDELVSHEREGAPRAVPVPLPSGTTAIVLYTSGSTGAPKGVELSHLSLLLVPTNNGYTTNLGPDETFYAVLPLFHVYGISDLINGPVLRRNTIILRERFRTADALETIERERITVLSGVPTMFHAMVAAHTGERDLSSVRMVTSGGAPMSPTQIARVKEAFPQAHFVEGYGLTETGASGTHNGTPFEFRHGSVGRAMVGIELMVIDAEGHPLPHGPANVGEILIRGAAIMTGYFRRPELTDSTLREGWLHTGDLGWMDADGYLYIQGRSKELIIRGGFNVYPKEVEDVLESHPAIAQAVVVGRPDEHFGEEVVAFVIPVDGAPVFSSAEVIEYCAGELAPYKYPRELFVRPALPLGPTGKVDKQALAREARGEVTAP